MAALTDDDIFNAPAAAPALAAPPPAAAPAPSGPPPLPNEPDASLLARAAVAEGDQNNPESWRNIAGVILNRAQKTGRSVADVLTEPNQFEAYGNGHIQRVDPSSPAYKAALQAVQGVKAGDVPYDSFYEPQIVAQRGVKPPFDPSQGTMVGTQLFGVGGYHGAPEGLTPDQQKIWDSLQVQPAVTGPGKQPSGGKLFTVGGQQRPVTQAQQTTLQSIAQSRGWNPNGVVGFDGPPFPLVPGGVLPRTPGAHYVDLDGKEHVVPGGPMEMAGGAIAGAVQGLGADTTASIGRLTGGFVGPGRGPANALAGLFGVPGQSNEDYFRANEAQQRNYAIQQGGNAFAQAGRFAGQAVPAALAAGAVPEIEVPAALGGRVASGLATNALRGVAATAPSVGANPAPALQQLATGAAAGVALPPVLRAAGVAGSRMLGPSAAGVSSEALDLADKAINQYGIPLRASQIAGTANPALAVADSNLISAPGSGFAANHRAQLQAFTRGVASTFGADSEKITPQVMSAARQNLGAQYDAFAANHSVPDVTQMHSDMDNVVSDASKVMPASELSPIEKQVQGIKDLTAQNGGTLPGDAYQALIRKGAPLDRAMQSPDSNIRYYAGKIKDALDGAMMATATSPEQAAFSKLNLQYKNLMTIKGLAAKADIQGAISPVQLQGVVNRSFDDRAFSGAGPLGDLADIAQTFIKQPPNSFSAQRLGEIAHRNWLPTALGGLALGAGTEFHDPGTALKLAAAAGLTKGAQVGVNAFSGLRLGSGAGRRLVSSPGAFGSAIGGAARSVEVPLSALTGVHLAPFAGGMAGSQVGNAVGANAQ